ncbi:transglycosylase SLT domain-containing protein [Herbaspirillum sp.]|uniref:transglycosylase SLT domain-containing protein n=1 Tax=Herbaspirillum sp. TaxID=1890675 RepID=UPI001B180527|nr:transglycosylase SLT domain-containing protein [Herbaspirillum sp.]MBO9538742.1 transglycosylase SLT domain-containing protein [Herbaspirillum sp.]
MRDKVAGFLLCLVVNLISQTFFSAFVFAQTIPASAAKYRGELVRAAHAGWGLDAPVAVFAAQIHQESGWNPEAVSQVGALGMAQFMPATARWWCETNGIASSACAPKNPTWAMRALVGYDRWLFDRVRGLNEFDRLWAMSRSYNGGLGHWQQEAAIVRPAIDHQSVDAACGKAKRHPSFCRENLDYPRRILIVLQPRYQGWGRSVMEPST